ncbi:hypothetical protein ACTFIV_008902 [Dictyostelium citrinum]
MILIKKIILIFILSFLFVSISLASSPSPSSESSSSPAASKYIYAIVVIENYQKQQFLIIDPWENNTIFSESLQLNFEIDDILIVEESNTFIIYSESTNQSLISINPNTLESNIINKISPPMAGFEDMLQPSVFINEKKVLYKPVVDINSGSEFSSLLRLDFESGTGTFVNISNEDQIPTLGSIPNVAYDVLNDYVFACYNSSSNNILVAFNETTSDIIETYGVIKNLQGFDVTMMFTDKLGNLFLVYQDNNGIVYICEVDSVLMECHGKFKYDIGTRPYAFTPYFLSRDKLSLVFITYIDENQFQLELVDFNHGFNSKKTIFSNNYFNNPFNVYWVSVTY